MEKKIKELVEELRNYSVPELCDGMEGGLYHTMDYQIKPHVTQQKIVGPAFTVKVPVSCGGVIVNPGDIIVGDRNGVCVIRPEEAEEVIARTRRKIEAQAWTIAEMERTGKVMSRVIFNKGK